MPIRVSPSLFTSQQFGRIRKTLCRDETLEGRQPIMVIVRAVIRFATIRRTLYFFRKSGRPLLPSEMPLLGELDAERKRLCLPRLRKHWSFLIAWKLWQGREAFFCRNRFKRVQGSHPTCPGTQNLSLPLGLPTVRARRIEPNRRAGASRRDSVHLCRGRRKHHGLARCLRPCREHSEADAYESRD